MVMVANKKTQKQMSDDLNLFLGSNTDKFTTWLHQLLTKLQSITAGKSHGDISSQGLSQDTYSLSFGQAVSWNPPFWTGKILYEDFLILAFLGVWRRWVAKFGRENS